MSPEAHLYLSRVDKIVTGVCGSEYRNLLRRAAEDPEGSALLYRRAYELFEQGFERVKASPEQYESLITWKDDKTFDRMGQPGLKEAFIEEYDGAWEGYEHEPPGD